MQRNNVAQDFSLAKMKLGRTRPAAGTGVATEADPRERDALQALTAQEGKRAVATKEWEHGMEGRQAQMELAEEKHEASQAHKEETSLAKLETGQRIHEQELGLKEKALKWQQKDWEADHNWEVDQAGRAYNYAWLGVAVNAIQAAGDIKHYHEYVNRLAASETRAEERESYWKEQNASLMKQMQELIGQSRSAYTTGSTPKPKPGAADMAST